jgi:hypothetical protein
VVKAKVESKSQKPSEVDGSTAEGADEEELSIAEMEAAEQAEIHTYHARLKSATDIMFNRFEGATTDAALLSTEDKMYKDGDGFLHVPALNIASMLHAESKSIITRLYERGAAKVRNEAAATVQISPARIPITRDGKPIQFTGWNGDLGEDISLEMLSLGGKGKKAKKAEGVEEDKSKKGTVETRRNLRMCLPAGIYENFAVTRVKKGQTMIPIPIIRPVLKAPWEIEFDVRIIERVGGVVKCSRVGMWLQRAGELVGLGNWRPRYGRFTLVGWSEV